MCASVASSSSVQRTFDPTALPSRWLDCPRKSAIIAGKNSSNIDSRLQTWEKIVSEKFVAFKTPLDDRFKDHISVAQRWTCKMLIDALKREQVSLKRISFGKKNFHLEKSRTRHWFNEYRTILQKWCRIQRETDSLWKDSMSRVIRRHPIIVETTPFFFLFSHGETPNEQQTNRFIEICRDFINTNPNDIIGTNLFSFVHFKQRLFVQVFIVLMVSIEVVFWFVRFFTENLIWVSTQPSSRSAQLDHQASTNKIISMN